MKIGIITMHKVLNFGSALQAYALQQKLNELGYDNEIIDYDFAPRKETRSFPKSIVKKTTAFVRALIMGFPLKKKRERFNAFYRNHYKLSSVSFSGDTISANPPRYDVYMTGSDQVWNPKHIGKDSNFLLSFAPKGYPKVSYASSFATSVIPDEYYDLYRKCLGDYKYISVREPSGVSLVKNFTGKEASVSCDPVFLLDRKQWDKIADEAQIKLKDKYILVYALYYMFDPYPELLNIISHVQKTLGYKVIYLNGRREDAFRPNSSVYKTDGPAEFVKLVRDAEIVITSSFHGVAFSLIYDKPLVAIVRKNDITDSRISSVLENLDANRSIVPYDSNCTFTKDELCQLKANQIMLEQYIESSTTYLKDILSKLFNKNTEV